MSFSFTIADVCFTKPSVIEIYKETLRSKRKVVCNYMYYVGMIA